MRRKAFLCLFILGFFLGCSSKEMKKESYALPELPSSFKKPLSQNEKSFVLVGLNDLNAQMSGIESHGLSIGGLDMLERYLSIINTVFKDENLVLSTGHLTQERSSDAQKNYIYQALGKLPIHAIGTSTRELKSGEEIVSPLINSNVFNIASRSLLENQNMKPYRIFERGGLKIGVLSVTPPDTKEVLNGLYFEDAVASVLKNYNSLKSEGVDIVTLISHYPPECETESPQFENERELICEEDSNLKKILERLPRNEIDIILTTGQRFSFGKINDVYVMNTPGNGLYLDLIKVVYNDDKKRINHSKTKHIGPVLLCQQFYDLTEDCFIGNAPERFERIQDTEYEQMPAKFLGVSVIGK